MNKEQFELWLNAKGFRAIAKVTSDKGDILIAEGEHGFPERHIRTLWLVDGGGPLWGRHVNHRPWDEIDGVLQPVTRKQRVREAVEDALRCLSATTTGH